MVILWVLLIPILIQWLSIGVDEFVFHRKRGLPRWERIGHPLDTLTVIACYLWVLWVAPTETTIAIYGGLVLGSSLFVTKDEFIHKDHCDKYEHWLHGLLFVTHPLSLVALGLLWPSIHSGTFNVDFLPSWSAPWVQSFILFQLAGIGMFFIYQVTYWNFVFPHKKMRSEAWKR